MFRLSAKKNRLELLENELITSNSLNIYDVYFEFDESWDGLIKSAVFCTGHSPKIAVPLDEENHCIVPWSILDDTNVGSVFKIGVFGLLGKKVILPTIWAEAGVLKLGAYSGDIVTPKDPDVYQEVLDALGKVYDHQNLTNRDAQDAHPIESITGLDELDAIDIAQIWN